MAWIFERKEVSEITTKFNRLNLVVKVVISAMPKKVVTASKLGKSEYHNV